MSTPTINGVKPDLSRGVAEEAGRKFPESVPTVSAPPLTRGTSPRARVIPHSAGKAQGFLATKFGNFVSPIMGRLGRIRDAVPVHVAAVRAYTAGHWLLTEQAPTPGQIGRDIVPAAREASTKPRGFAWLIVGILRFALAVALWPVSLAVAVANRGGRRLRPVLLGVLLLPRAAQLALRTRGRAAWVVVVLVVVVALALLPDGSLTAPPPADHP